MHPFSSHLNCLYRFIVFRSGDGIKIDPTNPRSYNFKSLLWGMGLTAFGFVISLQFDPGWLFMLCIAPGLILVYYVNQKADVLNHTYASQCISTITISDDIISLELLDDEEGGIYRKFSAWMDMPQREKVVDNVNIPLSAIRGYEAVHQEVNNATYYFLIAYVATIDEEGEEAFAEVPISPRFRKFIDIADFIDRMEPYLPEVEEISMENIDEYDPAYV